MIKYSVKKPFTVLVAVIAVIVLGIVSVTKISLDLLPQLSLPYLVVVTPYPGAPPERVEAEVSAPLEASLGTITGVANVTSTSSENFSIVQLEFEDGTNMDSAMVKVSSAIDQLSGSLPDMVTTPIIMEISMNMIATMYVAVERDGYDIYQLSDYVTDTVVPNLERQQGVAEISDIGLVEKTVYLKLDHTKIDELNEKLLAMTSDALTEAEQALSDAKEQLNAGQDALTEQENQFGSVLASGLFGGFRGSVDDLSKNLKSGILDLRNSLQDLADQIAPEEASDETAADETAGETETTEETEPAVETEPAGEAATSDTPETTDAGEAPISGDDEEATETASGAAITLPPVLQDLVDLFRSNGNLNLNLPDTTDPVSEENGVARGNVTADNSSEKTAEAPASEEGSADDAAASSNEDPAQPPSEEQIRAALQEQLSSVIDRLTQAANRTGTGAADGTEGGTDAGSSFSDLMALISVMQEVRPQIESIMQQLQELEESGAIDETYQNIYDGLSQAADMMDQLPVVFSQLETAFGGLTQAQLSAALGFSAAANQLTSAQAQLYAAEAQLQDARATALKQANLDTLLSTSVLSQLIFAQNFSMPAGYISGNSGDSMLLKVGEEYETADDISNALLAEIDGIGTIRISDIAEVTVIDNAGKSYARLNGEDAVLLSIYKGSTAGTNDVSRTIGKAIKALMAEDPELHIVTLVDQGEYIALIVEDIVKSMLLGALLAIIILAIFLRDFRPTFLVATSIPLSVLFALVLMYFSDLSLNIMTLSGLSIGIGMLVDNSVVVMENIFRLRGREFAGPRAAVQGTKQVAGSIIASTLTTICVFLPMVFATGTVRELLIPLALSVSYCLVASLIVAMTVVPAAASTVLKSSKPKQNRLFESILNAYGRSLRFFLKYKAIAIIFAVGVLAICTWRLVTMGIVILPKMSGDSIQVSIQTPEDDTREESYRKVDEALERILSIPGISDVGIMDAGSTLSLLGSFGGSSDSYGSYICYITLDGEGFSDDVQTLRDNVEAATKDLDMEVSVSTGGMSDMSALMSSGLTINVYGRDERKLKAISDDLVAIISEVEGFTEIHGGFDDSTPALQLVIDKNEAMKYGLTVAQIYAEIAARLTTSVTSTSITMDEMTMDVVIEDDANLLKIEELMDMEFTGNSLGSMSGSGSSMSSLMSSMGGSGSSMMGGSMSSMMGAMGGSMSSMMGAMGGSMSSMMGSMDSSMLEAFGGGSDGAGSTDLAALAESFGISLGDTGSEDEAAADETTDEAEAEAEEGSEENAETEEAKAETHKLSEFAKLVEITAPSSITRENLTRYIRISASTKEGYNTTLLSRELKTKLDLYQAPDGYTVELAGETTEVNEMVSQMSQMILLALLFIYLVMVAMFQSLLSPFIVLFTIPLAFSGGMIALIIAREQLSMLSLMGFLILMGTVVNNGIVFVDYANQLRIGGMERQDALVATGKTRMRPILMTALTTILAMGSMIFGDGMGSQMGKGMALVIAGGLIYATLMTLYIIPVMYDLFFKRMPLSVDTGDDLEDAPDDAAEFIQEMEAERLRAEVAAIEADPSPADSKEEETAPSQKEVHDADSTDQSK